MAERISIAEQIAEAKAELRMRYRVYPNMVLRARLTQAEMDRKIAVQHAIVETLQALDQQPELFGDAS